MTHSNLALSRGSSAAAAAAVTPEKMAPHHRIVGSVLCLHLPFTKPKLSDDGWSIGRLYGRVRAKPPKWTKSTTLSFKAVHWSWWGNVFSNVVLGSSPLDFSPDGAFREYFTFVKRGRFINWHTNTIAYWFVDAWVGINTHFRCSWGASF